MRSPVQKAWVQLVNKLFMQRGQKGGHLSPVWATLSRIVAVFVGRLVVIHVFVRWFYQYLSTLKNIDLYLLSAHYTPNPQGLLLQPLRKNLKG